MLEAGMHTIALLSQKGGAGKSTIARQLSVVASEKSDCLLIDLDPQKTTTGWWQRRQKVEPAPAMPQLLDLEGTPVSKALGALGNKAGFAFIDTRPAVTEQEAEVARLADTVIVPVRPSPDDLAAVKDTLAMLRRIKKTPLIIVNAAKNQRRAIDARAALSRFGVPVCPFHIADRAAYLDAALSGLGMSEIRGAGAAEAYAELSKIWQWIEEIRSGEA